MFVYFYYLIMYFFTLIFGFQVSNWASSVLLMCMDPDSDRFLKPFYRAHFFATYISGAFSIVNIGEKTLKEWNFENLSVDSGTKVACLILLFVALSNNAFYKTFEKEIVNMLQSSVKKFKAK